MKTKARVSVVIPTYNYADLVVEAIESVLAQTYRDFELIIVDQDSTDNTAQVVQGYLDDPRVSFHVNQQPGIVANWNEAVRLARGEYIKLLCADDKLHPSCLEKQVRILDENPSVSTVSCQKELFSDKHQGIPIKLPVSGYLTGRETVLAMTRYDHFLGEPSLSLFRKADLHVGLYRNFIWIVDWEMHVRLLTAGDCYIIPEVLCYARRHARQVTRRVFTDRQLEEYQLFKALHEGEYMQFSGEERIRVHAGLQRKVAACAAEMYKLLVPSIWDRGKRAAMGKLYTIVSAEKQLISASAFGLIARQQKGRLARALRRSNRETQSEAADL